MSIYIHLFFLVFLIGAGTILYMIALTLLVRRKDYQPLKSQCVGLIFASILGNYLYFSSVLYNKILENNRWALWQELKKPGERDLGTEIAIEASCFLSNAQFWLFRAIWLFPYVFRSVRLKLIWGMQREYLVSEDDAAEAEHRNSSHSRTSVKCRSM